MKAEERHRLAENDLSKGLTQLTTGVKRPSNMIILMLGLIVALGIVYWYWSSTAANRVSRAWIQYYEQRDRLADAPEQWKSGPAGHAIQLGAADQAFDRGFSQLFIDPQQALKEFEQAAQQYESLSKTASHPEILLRALIGAARSNENLGDVTKSISFYDAAINKYGTNNDWKDHPLLKDARSHKEKLSATGDNSLNALYQSWATKLKQVSTGDSTLKAPQIPSIPLPPLK